MKKKGLIISIIIVVVAVLIYFYVTGGLPVPTLKTVGSDEETIMKTSSVDDLEDGCFYVWHNDNSNDITEDLENTSSMDVFKLCPSGEKNWDKDTTTLAHVLWFDSDTDQDIPTLYEGDKLLYVSSTEVPFEGISWERYADYGYSIGVANLIGDESGHYHINNADGDGFTGYIYEKSDAVELNQYKAISNLFLDKVGETAVCDDGNLVSKGGTVAKLEKNGSYVCEWYTGTFYQDFIMIANVHPFCFLESFTTYDYEFLHSSCISISIPEWFKSGYYYANGIGFFRYVKDSDRANYNGEPYDEDISWNEPIIIKDERGDVVYDPSTGYTNPTMSNESIYFTDESNSEAGQITINSSDENVGDINESLDTGDSGMDELPEGQYIEQ